MNQYDTYKPSNIEWLGEIPAHWQMKKLRREVTVQEGPGIMANDFHETGVPLLRIAGMKGNYASLEGCNFLDPKLVEKRWSHFRLNLHDLIISCSGSTDLVCEVDQETVGSIPYTGLIRFVPSPQVNKTYLKHYIKSAIYQTQVDLIKAGSIIQHYGPSHLSQFFLLAPPLNEQAAIAAYLDDKTAKIDTLIDRKRRLIDLLKEEKAALINEAVTKGINPNVPMKDSGIEWLGDIPAHWEVKKLKLVSKNIGDGIHGTPNYTEGCPFYFINGNNLNNGVITITERTNSVDEQEYEKWKIVFKQGTLFLSINGTIGNLALYNGEPIILGKSAAYIECDIMIHNRFLYYLFQSEYVITYFDTSLSGTTIKNLSLHTLRNTTILLPTESEQAEIVRFLEFETAKIDHAISRVEREIELMQEYRTALISEVVTGKVRVV